MTRINCVPVTEFSDAHLGAEYRELPRVFRLAQAAYERGDMALSNSPEHYTLGAGHVRFFYTRLGYLQTRFQELVKECQRRGRQTTYTSEPFVSVPTAWWRQWSPEAEDLALNRARIKERS